MIITIITIALAFYWLLIETDYLRVRLPYGLPLANHIYKTWAELKPLNPNKQYPFWVRFPESMSPLCGWDYLENTLHIVPEYKVELISEHSRLTVKSHNTQALKDVFRVYRNPHIHINLRRPTRSELEYNHRQFAAATN